MIDRTQNQKDSMHINLSSKYGISVEEYEEMYIDQKGVCAICNEPETARDKRRGIVKLLAVDHCHETGKVRGLLCFRCNMLLGYARDSRDILSSAQAYLFMNK